MAYTGQQICDRTREQLNDDAKREFPDSEILNYVNDCVKVIYDKRPEFFVGLFSAFPADMNLAANWPLEDRLLPAVIDYAVSMSQRPDDEEASQQIASAAMGKFMDAIKGS
jgi:hypothetical protein